MNSRVRAVGIGGGEENISTYTAISPAVSVFQSSASNSVADAYSTMFEGDLDDGDKFPRAVYPWTPKHRVYCGNGRRLQIF